MKSFKNPSRAFSTISQNSISYRAWFAILSFHDKPPSKMTEIILCLLEYVHLMTQMITTNRTTLYVTPGLLSTIMEICKAINPGYLVSLQVFDGITVLHLFPVMLIYTVLKYSIFFYIVILSIRRKTGPSIVLVIWRWIFRLQGRFLYFFTTTFWIGFYRNAFFDRMKLEPGPKVIVMAISCGMMVVEFIFTFFLLTRIWYSLPNKRFMAAKNQYTDVVTLVQKFVTQIIRTVWTQTSILPLTQWICTLMAFIFSMIRNVYYFTSFPHYTLKASLFQSSLLMIVTFQPAAYLIHLLINSVRHHPLNQSFATILWIILSIVAVRFSISYTKHVWFDFVVKETDKKTQKFWIHRLTAIKEILQTIEIASDKVNETYSYDRLVKRLVVTQLQNVLNRTETSTLTQESPNESFSKTTIQKLMMNYLEDLRARSPSDDLIRLYIASYYAKKLKRYGIAIKILRELQHSSSSNTALNASLVIYTLQQSIISEYKNNQNKLNMHSYIQNLTCISQLKEEMFKQAELQINLYRTFTQKLSQDLGAIFNLGQQVNKQRCKIEKKINKQLGSIPEYYIEPLMLFAHHSLILNHAPHKYLNYIKTYAQRYKKYEKMFLANEICPENVYQKENRVIIMSGNKKDLGIVHYMSNNFIQTLGKSIVGYHVCAVLPERFRASSYQIANGVLERGDKESFLDSLISTFEYDFQQGSFLPCWNYFNISPFLSKGLFYLLLIRMPPEIEECLLVKEGNEVIGFTAGIGNELGLSKLKTQDGINLNVISRKLVQVNQAFDIISPLNKSSGNDKTEKLKYEEAQEICSTFSNKGEIIELNSLRRLDSNSTEHQSSLYHCKFETKFYAYSAVRVITLKKMQDIGSYKMGNDDNTEFEDKTELDKLDRENEIDNDDIESEHLIEIPIEPQESTPDNFFAETQRTTTRPLVTNQDSEATARRLISPRKFTIKHNNVRRLETRKLVNHEDDIAQKDQQVNRFQPQDILLPNLEERSLHPSSRNGNKSQIAHIKLSKDFEKAVSTPSNPRFFRLLIMSLYIIFVGILACQIVLHVSVSTDIETLETRKSVMELSASRTGLINSIYGVTRNIWVYAMGRRNASNYPPNYQPPYYFSRLKPNLQSLAQANKNMMVAMDTIDSQSRTQLMQSDVRMFDTYFDRSFLNITSFQATDRIIEVGLRGVTVGVSSLSGALPAFNFTLRNSLNDLLVVNEDLESFLAEAIEEQGDLIITRNMIILLLNIALFALLFLIFCFTVMKQYQSEKRNMTALGKLEQNEVIKVMDRVITFQTMLQEEKEFEIIQSLETYDSSATKKKEPYELSKGQPNKKDVTGRTHRLQGITRKYQLYPVKFIVYISTAIGLIFAKFFVINDFINNMSYIVEQLFFSTTIGPQMQLAALIMLDMTSGSDTQIHNQPMIEQFGVQLNVLKNAIHNISDILKNRDNSYDPVIQGILFDNACDYTTPNPTVDTYCRQLRQINDTSGFIARMIGYENMLLNFQDDYNNCNKSIQALTSIEAKYLTARTQYVLFLLNVMTVISNRLDISFENMLTQDEAYISVISGILMGCLVITVLLLQVSLINRLRQSDNGFRNVLKVFPARVVLSNFMLKSYLTQTWKGSLELAKLIRRD